MASVDDPFELLGVQRRFAIDPRALQEEYLRRSASLHPDRFPDPMLQAEASRKIAAINDARAVLLDDERRANALLTLLGGPRSDQDKSLPVEFLARIMDVRQDMEAALAGNDSADRRRIERWAQSQRQEFIRDVSHLFDQVSDDRQASEDTLRHIRRTLNAWRYIERMIEQLDPDYRPAM